MSEASRLITGALLGEDGATVVVGGRSYYIEPPTIKRIAKAAQYLDSVEECNSIASLLDSMKSLDAPCRALSAFIRGDDSLTGELANGTLEEVIAGLKIAYSLLSIKDFYELSTLAKSVARMVAVPRP